MQAKYWMLLLALVAIVLFGPWSQPAAADAPTTVTYTYDDAGRLVQVTYGPSTHLSYTYDDAGNLLSRLVERGFDIYLPITLRDYQH